MILIIDMGKNIYTSSIYRTSELFMVAQFGGGKYKWETLSHNGVYFPVEYDEHRIPIIYNGEQIILNKKSEEYATIYARYIDTEYVKNPKFNKNFWNDWKVLLDDSRIQEFDKIDFSLIYNYLLDIKEKKKNMSDDEKQKIKEAKDKINEVYSVAYVNGKEEKIGNYLIEPPGIFIGRGCHPKIGKIKRRIYPEHVTINIGKESKIPEIQESLKDHKWKKVIHDRTVEWLASWKDTITGKTKYVWLSAHSDMKGKNDMEKFDLAVKLGKKIKTIRKTNDENMVSDDITTRQIATALYFIDKLALRVGNEKNEDSSDTVGVTSLRCEHIELLEDGKIKLDFLGKDSVRYINTVKVEDIVYENIKKFKENKDKYDSLFDKITPNDVNKYLQKFMKGLTAKVFRTYNATYLFKKELKKISEKYATYDEDDKIDILLNGFNSANAKVAMLCNHQKNISKSLNSQLDSINESIDKIKKKIKKIKKNKSKKNIESLKAKLEKYKAKKALKIETKNISLGTSKINYIDPRVSIEFINKHNIPIEKIFSKSLIEKFKWAINSVNIMAEIADPIDETNDEDEDTNTQASGITLSDSEDIDSDNSSNVSISEADVKNN